MKPDYQENTIYIRERHSADGISWEAFAKALGRGMILQNLESKEMGIKMMTFILWGVNEFGLENYGTEMAKLEGAPDDVEYPVIEEEPVL